MSTMVLRLLAIFLASLFFSSGYASVDKPDTRALDGGHHKDDISFIATGRAPQGAGALWDTGTGDADPVQVATGLWAPPYGRPSNRCWYGPCGGDRGSRQV